MKKKKKKKSETDIRQRTNCSNKTFPDHSTFPNYWATLTKEQTLLSCMTAMTLLFIFLAVGFRFLFSTCPPLRHIFLLSWLSSCILVSFCIPFNHAKTNNNNNNNNKEGEDKSCSIVLFATTICENRSPRRT